MPTVLTNFVSFSCDGDGCDKNVTFPQTPEGEAQAIRDNPWMNSARFVQTADSKFVYCSDECEIKAAGAGAHNKKIIVVPQASNAVDLAAQAAERARQATEALKSGQGKVVLS